MIERFEIGDHCPECESGRISVYSTHIETDKRIRYLGCDFCEFKPQNNKQIIPLIFAPKQRPRFIRRNLNRR